jgi:hypothetical protein
VIVGDDRFEMLTQPLLPNTILHQFLRFVLTSMILINCRDLLDQCCREWPPNVFRLDAVFHPEEFFMTVLPGDALKYGVAFDSL